MFQNISALSDILKPALQGLTARQHAIANNLANADTPGYKASEVLFEENLQAQMAHRQVESVRVSPYYTDQRHMSLGLPEESAFQKLQVNADLRNDKNNVDIDLEMTKMAQASISYNAVSQMLAGRYSGLKYVINEGGR